MAHRLSEALVGCENVTAREMVLAEFALSYGCWSFPIMDPLSAAEFALPSQSSSPRDSLPCQDGAMVDGCTSEAHQPVIGAISKRGQCCVGSCC